MRRFAVLLIGLSVAEGCRSASPSSRAEQERGDPYLIVAAELEASPRANLYDAIFELRPRWFTRSSRADVGDVLVYLEDQMLGRADVLRRFRIGEVAEVRYLSASEAMVRFGRGNGNRPAIVVHLDRS